MTFDRKTLTTALVALTVSATVIASAAPAFCVGSWLHGEARSSVFRKPWLPGPSGPRLRLEGRCSAGPRCFGAGAIASTASAGYAPATYAPECSFERRPIVDSWGRIVGYNRVRICD